MHVWYRATTRLRVAPILLRTTTSRHLSTAADGIVDTLPDSSGPPEEPTSSSSSSSSHVPALRRAEWDAQDTPALPTTTQASSLVAFPTPPFHTHEFFAALQRSFPENVARSLMKATRALLVHRTEKLNAEMFNRKDFDNQAYLFRAALSELRTEMTMRTRNEFAALQVTTSEHRRDVEALDGKMKEDIGTLKNDLQLDIENRKHDSRAELKTFEMAIEDLGNKSQIALSDIRTDIEQAKWINTRRGLLLIGTFGIIIITASEMSMRERQREKEARRKAKEAAAASLVIV